MYLYGGEADTRVCKESCYKSRTISGKTHKILSMPATHVSKARPVHTPPDGNLTLNSYIHIQPAQRNPANNNSVQLEEHYGSS